MEIFIYEFLHTNLTPNNLQIQLPVKFQSNITRLEAINIQIRPTQGVIEFSEIEVRVHFKGSGLKGYKEQCTQLFSRPFIC